MKGNDNTPRHVAIIMDGNGRWAQERGKERSAGHLRGVESVRTVLKAARAKGVEVLTLYVFSTENWNRPAGEVEMLMDLFCKSVMNEVEELTEQGVRVRVIGDRSKLSDGVKRSLGGIEEATAANNAITLILAFNYSSREELTSAIKAIGGKLASGEIKEGDITERTVGDALYTGQYPDPDLIIRTGGEYRLSNFLLWQSAYSELYFTETYWPDFGAAELEEALGEYARRERRFGKV